MEKNERDVLDTNVLRLIEQGQAHTSSGLTAALQEDMRAVDRSLQRLRKAGKIDYDGPSRTWMSSSL
jgi:hypothetical protein